MVIGIDKIIDMIRTLVNVTGTTVCAVLVAKTTPLTESQLATIPLPNYVDL
jgi:Na+/H+-dicarboxylate symporter